MTLNPSYAWVRQLSTLAVVLMAWEAAGYAGMLNPLYMPTPSAIGRALAELFGSGSIWTHLEATFGAALGGLALGIVVGILLGVLAALIPLIAELLEPVMTLLNAIPRVILAPLFVIWLGIGLASKVALAFILVAVLIFFTVFSGIRQVDRRDPRQSQGGGRIRLHRRLRRRVRGGEPRARLPAVVRAEHLQRGADVRAHPADHGGGAGDLRGRRPAGKIPAALELSAVMELQRRHVRYGRTFT